MKTDGNEEGNENTSAVNRFYAGGIRYNLNKLNLVAAYEETDWGRNATAKASTRKKDATLGGSYRFDPVTLYLQGQYFNGVNKLDGFSEALVSTVALNSGSDFLPGNPWFTTAITKLTPSTALTIIELL